MRLNKNSTYDNDRLIILGLKQYTDNIIKWTVSKWCTWQYLFLARISII